MPEAAPDIGLATDPLASDLVVACEETWRAIQSHHPELPPVVMLLGTGVERGRLVKLGHWWGGRWLADGDVRGEVLLAGEALHLKPEDVFEVLLHEAAHGINAARGIKDTSRGGRYHNARFKKTAVEVGLDVEQMDPYGFAKTSVRADTASRYSNEIERLAGAMRIARRIPQSALTSQTATEGAETGGTPSDGRESTAQKVPPAECGCGRKMRMAPSVLAQGPVTCGNCGSEFVVDRAAEREERPAPNRPDMAGAAPTSRAEAVLHDAAQADDGLDVLLRLGGWRQAFGTEAERPLETVDDADQKRLTSLARAVLEVDGVLHGRRTALGQVEVRAGDRVRVSHAADVPDGWLPEAGTPGTVTDVDRDGIGVTIDFATAGTYDVDSGGPVAHAIEHDYCTPPDGASLIVEGAERLASAEIDL